MIVFFSDSQAHFDKFRMNGLRVTKPKKSLAGNLLHKNSPPTVEANLFATFKPTAKINFAANTVPPWLIEASRQPSAVSRQPSAVSCQRRVMSYEQKHRGLRKQTRRTLPQ